MNSANSEKSGGGILFALSYLPSLVLGPVLEHLMFGI